MREVLYLAWRYLLYHKLKTAILIASVTLIIYLPIGLHVLVRQSAAQLNERAAATPLVIGAKGSPLELTLNTLYFRAEVPERIRYRQVERVAATGLAIPIPIYARFRTRDHPIVGVGFEYFGFRGCTLRSGRFMAVLGECVVGSEVARELPLRPGSSVVSSPENVFDLAGVYPLKMNVVGVLAPSGTPDDRAVFVDLKTAWIIEGLGHGHRDLADPEAASDVLSREGERLIANAAVHQFQEVDAKNLESFHFHGNSREFPITAVIAVPKDHKSETLLRGQYLGSSETCQIVRPGEVMDGLLATIFTVQGYVVLCIGLVGGATLATMVLVFLLSLRLRRREIETLVKVGGSRSRVALVMASEMVAVLLAGMLLAGILMSLTAWLGPALVPMLLA